MSKKAKVQTNEYMVNVLVETSNSNNQHCSHLDKNVILTKVLSNEEIIELWEKRNEDDRLQLAKDWINKQDGYATSNCIDDTQHITYGSIVKYEL